MRYCKPLATSLLLISASTAALAAATDEQAAQIRTALQVYVGAEPGVVDVRPSGDDYIVTLDPAPYLAKITQPGFTSKIDPFVITVRPKGNGQWDVSQSGPYNFMISVPDQLTLDAKIASYAYTGVFDESIVGFLSSEHKLSGLTLNQMVMDPNKTKSTSVVTLDNWTSTSTGTPRGVGTMDLTATQSLGKMTIESKMELPPELAGGPPMDYTVTVAGNDGKTTISGFRTKPILDLMAWFVARPSRELILRDQAQLKEKINAALPLWDNIEGDSTYRTIAINTAIGPFGMTTAGGTVGMSGVTKEGRFREALSFSGLTIPPGIAPPWSSGLVPTDFKIDFALSGVNLEAPVGVFLEKADFSKDPPLPPDVQLELLPAFAPTNSMMVKFADGLISAPDYAITYDGDMKVNFAGFPTGTFNVRMKGLDAVIAKVQAAAAADPIAAQGIAGLIAAKGLGKAEADGTTLWAVEISEPAKVTVNGMDMSAFMGAPPAQ